MSNTYQNLLTKEQVVNGLLLTAIIVVAILVSLGQTHALTVTTTAVNSGNTTVTGSAGALSAPIVWVVNFLKGTGGLFAAILALTWAAYEAFVSKSLKGVMLGVGIAITAFYGPEVLATFFGAII